MIRFLLRRLGMALATLLVLSLVTFLLGAMAPGDPVQLLLGEKASPARANALRRQLRLDAPILVRYADWLGRFVQGDFGVSFARRGEKVAPSILRRYPVTLQLALFAAGIAVAVGLPLGLVAALNRETWIDRAATITALMGISIPSFVSLPLLVLVFALNLRWFPVTYEQQPWQLLLPALALGLRPAALIARMTRASFIETLGQDYVRTARAKGLAWGPTILRHAGKNAVIPILTVLGTSVGYLLGGSFVVESIFGIPGVGQLSVLAISGRDYPVIQAVTLLGAGAFISVNLLVDLLYGFLDPRLRAASAT